MTEQASPLADIPVMPERMPTGSAYVDGHHIEAALRSLRHAEAATPSDAAMYLARAQQHVLYASRSLAAAQGQWREYNARLDRLVAFLASRADDDPQESAR